LACLSVIVSFCVSVFKLLPRVKFCHNFCIIDDSILILGMHVYLMELHFLNGERSRSSFKVKGKKIIIPKWRIRGQCVSDKHISFFTI